MRRWEKRCVFAEEFWGAAHRKSDEKCQVCGKRALSVFYILVKYLTTYRGGAQVAGDGTAVK